MGAPSPIVIIEGLTIFAFAEFMALFTRVGTRGKGAQALF
jgi:hypothetical protein